MERDVDASTIQLNAQGVGYSGNPAYLRYLLIAEVTEIFMMTQGRGWFQGSDEGSKGEGLSRFLSGQFLAMNGFLGLGYRRRLRGRGPLAQQHSPGLRQHRARRP